MRCRRALAVDLVVAELGVLAVVELWWSWSAWSRWPACSR
jgi:hypothetical protein